MRKIAHSSSIISLKNRIRNIFIAGLLVTVPISITYFFLIFLFRKLDGVLAPVFKRLLLFFNISIDGYLLPGLGGLALIGVVFCAGLITRNVLGKKLVDIGERVVIKIPLVRSIYGGAKQFLEVLTLSSTGLFQQVVLIEYPRKGLYALGFITSDSEGEVQFLTAQHVVNVFVPTTPNPTSGMLVLVPQAEIIPLSMTVEDGIKLIMSGGMVVPKFPKEQSNPAPTIAAEVVEKACVFRPSDPWSQEAHTEEAKSGNDRSRHAV